MNRGGTDLKVVVPAHPFRERDSDLGEIVAKVNLLNEYKQVRMRYQKSE